MTAGGTTTIVATATLFAAYYFVVKRLLIRWARVRAARTRRWRGRSVLEKAALYEVVFVVASHLVVVGLLLAAVLGQGVAIPALAVGPATVALLPLGALLGVAQMVTSIFVCRLLIVGIGVVATRQAVRAGTAGGDVISPEAWTDYSRAGWMRHHLVAARAVPRALSIPLTTLQVVCEEVVFRGVFPVVLAAGFAGAAPWRLGRIPWTASGLAAGLVVAGVLFVVMQAFHMPNWRSAMFPVVGALIMAAGHGWLVAVTGQLWPLAVAHAVSFFAAAKR